VVAGGIVMLELGNSSGRRVPSILFLVLSFRVLFYVLGLFCMAWLFSPSELCSYGMEFLTRPG
jgi:hypothetical protein